MKRQYYLILGGLIGLLSIFGFAESNKGKTSADKSIVLGKELVYAETNFNKDSTKLDEKTTEINIELIKINDELSALEEEIEMVHEKTIASYYHDKFVGRKTASGTTFCNKKHTAAHKTLPFGTKVRVTNLSNEESIIVEITDRGPFIKGRQIDLSKKAFIDLAGSVRRGVLDVKVEILPEDYTEKRTELEEELSVLAGIPKNIDLKEFTL